jgi:hypothetical protein
MLIKFSQQRCNIRKPKTLHPGADSNQGSSFHVADGSVYAAA